MTLRIQIIKLMFNLILSLVPLFLFSCSSYKIVSLDKMNLPTQQEYINYIDVQTNSFAEKLIDIKQCENKSFIVFKEATKSIKDIKEIKLASEKLLADLVICGRGVNILMDKFNLITQSTKIREDLHQNVYTTLK